MAEMEINWPGEGAIGGSHPVVVVGANGSGKTKLGVELERMNSGATRIPAYRQIAAPENLNLQNEESINQQLRQHRKQMLSHPWIQGSDIQQLMLKLFAEDASVSFQFTQAARRGEPTGDKPPETTASKVCDLWARVFTGRDLVFGTTPTVISSHGGTKQQYPATKMSDGERAAFYLACAVLDAQSGLVIVDEPDTFLHPVLMRQLWNELELERADCRFVYITHELGFALSRSDPQFLIAKPSGKHELLPAGDTLPSDVVEDVLGALTLSVTARVLIYCESTRRGPDYQLYNVWFNHPDQGVMPSGTSDHVVQSVRVTSNEGLFKGGSAYGVIDGDEWDSENQEKMKSLGVFVIGVNEIESLFCLEGVFLAVATHLNFAEEAAAIAFRQLQERVRLNTKPPVVTRYALQRLKRLLRGRLAAMLDDVSSHPDRQQVRESLEQATDSSEWDFNPINQLEKEVVRIEQALGGTWEDALRVLHGKDVLGVAASELGVVPARYVDVVLGGLSGKFGVGMSTQLEKQLQPYLPPRNLGL